MNDRERNDLIISWFTVSFAFAWIGLKVFSIGGAGEFLSQLAIMLVAVGTGFILHELAHKYVAIHYGAHAEFRAWRIGLLLALGLAVISNGGFVFAAPGAVYVVGNNIGVRKNGIISLAGPVANLLIVLVFGLAFAAMNPSGFAEQAMLATMYVNFFLAAFNMLPIFPLDGSKVFYWSKLAWFATIAIAAAGVLLFPIIVAVLKVV
ncbi:MAG: site-2 protease family protein [Candidatus Diapherotrites archaeon]|uniref:Site-2 protease family protein n=1 Tax=Candidatus Iainarchaeum sp. TaxID=3101447 RepID=A0A8T3YLU4_9ARCH|nr:site-2 protease family protein [Candidatus Diapherotrites archaeon]